VSGALLLAGGAALVVAGLGVVLAGFRRLARVEAPVYVSEGTRARLMARHPGGGYYVGQPKS
jgi:hypothetical protein